MVDDTGEVASYIPVTSTITNAKSEQYSQGVTSLSGQLYGTAEALFDGNLDTAVGDKTTTGSSAPTTPFAEVSFNFASSPLTSTIGNVRVYFKSNLSNPTANQVQDVSISVNGGAFVPATDFYATSGGTTNDGWQDLGTNNLTTLSIKSTYGGGGSFGTSIYGFEADGEIVTEGNNILTFTSPNLDLKFFNPGDVLGDGPSGFTPVLYTGNGGTQSVTGVGFSPSLVWIKDRTVANSHALFDTVRGTNLRLKSDDTSAESQSNGSLTSFDANGFTVGNNPSVNGTSDGIVAWCWDAGDTTVTNNDGTLESQVRSNGNFSVITVQNFTPEREQDSFGHGLSSAPKFIIGKNRGETQSWPVYTETTGTGKFFYLNSNTASSGASGGNYYNQPPTDSVIHFRAAAAPTNQYVFYAWTETPGVSSFGSWIGDGTTTGPVVDCGFEPAFVLYKSVDSGSWIIFDNKRNTSNPRTNALCPDLDIAEITTLDRGVNFLSNGFEAYCVADTYGNESGVEYIYAAFAGSGSEGTVVSTDLAANTMTVNGGDYALWNQTTVWSSQASVSGDPTYNKPVTDAFDGNSTTRGGGISIGSPYSFTWNPAPSIVVPNGSSIKAKVDFGDQGVAVSADINGVSTSLGRTVTGGGGSGTYPDGISIQILYTNNTGSDVTFTNFVMEGSSGETGFSLVYYISLDDVWFVDTGVLGAPPTVATGPEKSGTGTFVSTNGTNSMSISNSNLDWISNDNRLSQNFYVQPLVTRLNKDNPAHVALQQAIVTAFSTVKTNSSPALTGDLYRLLAGETLTAAEIATLTDRLTAATHGDRPFHLDGYYPLYYTAVGANAASPEQQ